jgi:hypothetical protein
MQGHVLIGVPLLQVPPTNHQEALHMLTRKTPDTLATAITLKGQGEEITFNVTYFNRTQDAIKECLEKYQATPEAQDDPTYPNLQAVLFITKTLDSEYPLTLEGLREMERDRPGMVEVLFYGFHQARRVELVKN